MNTAARLLQRQGYHGTGLNQILADAESPKGSLYFHFPGGKEQLAAEAIGRSGSQLDAALAEHRRANAVESLDAYLADVARLLATTDFTGGCPIATVALEVGATLPVVGDACHHAFGQLLQQVRGWLEDDGFAAHDAEQRAFLVYAAIEGSLVFAKAQRSTEPIERLRTLLAQIVQRPGATPPDRRARRPA